MAGSYVFLMKGKVCEETNQLSFQCYILSNIWEETSGGNHGTKRHHHFDNAHSQHQQTFGLLSCMHQIETENCG